MENMKTAKYGTKTFLSNNPSDTNSHLNILILIYTINLYTYTCKGILIKNMQYYRAKTINFYLLHVIWEW